MSPIDAIPDLLLTRARAGRRRGAGPAPGTLSQLSASGRPALIGQALRVRLDASDLVQETFLKAAREFGQFLGSTEPELTAWLRQILVRTLANQAKHHRRLGRDYQRQESLEAMLDRSSEAVQHALATPSESPSTHAVRREQAVLLADALEKLPADYREVFILRNLEHIPFDEVAARWGDRPARPACSGSAPWTA